MNQIFKASALAAAVILPFSALATPAPGESEITLSGGGGSDKDFDNNVVSFQASWGKYLSEQSLWGVRQTLNISDSEGESTNFDGSTRLFYDYHFGSGNTRPFIGVSIGGVYGENVDDTFMAGPEVGIKHWVHDKVFIVGLVEYHFLFDSANDIDSRYDDGAFFYTLGFGYNF